MQPEESLLAKASQSFFDSSRTGGGGGGGVKYHPPTPGTATPPICAFIFFPFAMVQ
ncbi:hypothetical protein AGMMS49959_08120 [Planctomycetales bacterium]|nr:hypothetical protein AGMMS49959_08120 [Planctomycetales bacterium]